MRNLTALLSLAGFMFIGSTADRTVDRLPCDLVVIKSPHFVVPSEGK